MRISRANKTIQSVAKTHIEVGHDFQTQCLSIFGKLSRFREGALCGSQAIVGLKLERNDCSEVSLRCVEPVPVPCLGAYGLRSRAIGRESSPGSVSSLAYCPRDDISAVWNRNEQILAFNLVAVDDLRAWPKVVGRRRRIRAPCRCIAPSPVSTVNGDE